MQSLCVQAQCCKKAIYCDVLSHLPLQLLFKQAFSTGQFGLISNKGDSGFSQCGNLRGCDTICCGR